MHYIDVRFTSISIATWYICDRTIIFLDKHMAAMAEFAGGFSDAPPAPWMFALAGREHSKRCVCRWTGQWGGGGGGGGVY